MKRLIEIKTMGVLVLSDDAFKKSSSGAVIDIDEGGRKHQVRV